MRLSRLTLLARDSDFGSASCRSRIQLSLGANVVTGERRNRCRYTKRPSPTEALLLRGSRARLRCAGLRPAVGIFLGSRPEGSRGGSRRRIRTADFQAADAAEAGRRANNKRRRRSIESLVSPPSWTRMQWSLATTCPPRLQSRRRSATQPRRAFALN